MGREELLQTVKQRREALKLFLLKGHAQANMLEMTIESLENEDFQLTELTSDPEFTKTAFSPTFFDRQPLPRPGTMSHTVKRIMHEHCKRYPGAVLTGGELVKKVQHYHPHANPSSILGMVRRHEDDWRREYDMVRVGPSKWTVKTESQKQLSHKPTKQQVHDTVAAGLFGNRAKGKELKEMGPYNYLPGTRPWQFLQVLADVYPRPLRTVELVKKMGLAGSGPLAFSYELSRRPNAPFKQEQPGLWAAKRNIFDVLKGEEEETSNSNGKAHTNRKLKRKVGSHYQSPEYRQKMREVQQKRWGKLRAEKAAQEGKKLEAGQLVSA